MKLELQQRRKKVILIERLLYLLYIEFDHLAHQLLLIDESLLLFFNHFFPSIID